MVSYELSFDCQISVCNRARIEDATGNQDRFPYDFHLAVERVAAAAEAARTLHLFDLLTR
jgi:hypothetical protein